MTRALLRIAAGLAAAALVLAGPARAQDEDDGGRVPFLSMGTGAVGGVYYPVGRAICRLANREAPKRLRCSVESTPGSVFNIDGLGRGDLDFAIVQSDTQFDAWTGRGIWNGRPQRELRSVMALHPELLTLIVRARTGISRLDLLSQRTLNIGPAGSGSRSTYRQLEKLMGWSDAERPRVSELKTDIAQHELCKGPLDATLLLVGHPSAVVRQHLEACSARLVPVTGPEVDKLVASAPFYRRGVIPAGTYGNPAAVPSFGVSATLLTTARTDEYIVYRLVMAVLDNLEELRAAHPSLAELNPEEMARDSLTAPLHPGAERAYREKGLLK